MEAKTPSNQVVDAREADPRLKSAKPRRVQLRSLAAQIVCGLLVIAAILTLSVVQAQAQTKPGAPENLEATANGDNRIDLNWTAPSDPGGSPIRGYRIEVQTVVSDWLVLVATTGNTDTEYSNIGVPAGALRRYRVSAINTDGAGLPSNVDEATTADFQLGQVMDVDITPHDGALEVEWNRVTDAHGYKVQWASAGENYNSGTREETITSGLTTTQTIGSLSNGTEYRVRVIATSYGFTDGPPSDEARGTPGADTPVPALPLAGVGILGLLLALFGSRAVRFPLGLSTRG